MNHLTETELSQARIAAVLGPEEVAKLDGEEASPGPGHNRPPSAIDAEPPPIDLARQRVDEEITSANKWAEQVKVIDSEEKAKALADKLDQLTKLFQKYDAMRAAEKRPHDEKSAEVQENWRFIFRLKICKEALQPLESDWLRREKLRLAADRQEKERVAREAQRRADQLAEQAKAGGPNVVGNRIDAADAAAEAERAREAVAAVPVRAQSRGNLGGRARSLKRVAKAQVVDWDKCYQHYRLRGEVRDVLATLASADARHGVKEIPGCFLWTEDE